MAQVWFVTGVSSGLGLEIALKALSTGAKVIGTVRSRQRAADAVKKIEDAGGKCLQLDVTDAPACPRVFKQAEEIYGQIDILVNNAGMSWLGPVEDFTDAEAKEQMEVCFYGPLRLMQASLPGFRQRKTGSIVNVTSIAGLDGLPCCGLYAASKWALEGATESLARELAQYNIEILLVEPGAFRTNFLGAYKIAAASKAERYIAAQEVLDRFAQVEGKQPGDPVKGAARIVELVSGTGAAGKLKGKVMRLPLGPDCVKRFDLKIETMSKQLELAREAAMSTNID